MSRAEIHIRFPADRIAGTAMILQIAISFPLWLSHGRAFPLIPLFDFMPSSLPAIASWALLAFAVSALVAFIFRPEKHWLRITTLVLFSILAISDLNRLQPWLYLYLAIWVSGFWPSQEKGLEWLLAAVYVWGGIHKISPYFAEDNFQWFMSAFNWTSGIGNSPLVGYLTALAEIGLGVLLLTPGFRRTAFWLALPFHAFIILLLSPLGHNWNSVVIPWNLAMILLVWVVSKRQEKRLRSKPVWVIVSWVWVAPLLNPAGLTPHAFSWNLYSNLQDERSLFIDQGTVCKAWRPVWSELAYDRKSKLLLDDWSMKALRVPVWNGPRTDQVFLEQLGNCCTQPEASGVLILRVNRFNRTGEKIEILYSAP